MTQYTIVFSRAAQKALAQLDQKTKIRVDAAIRVLSIDPFPPNSRLLKGSSNYRLRAGDYRIIYSVNNNVLTVTIFELGHRREIYRNF